MIVARVAVGEVAAHRGHVAHDGVGDDLRGVAQDGKLRPHDLGCLERGFARAPADLQHAALFLDVLQPGDAADVHQVLGSSEPQLEQRQQALAAGENLGAVSQAREQGDGFRHRGGRMVVER